MSKPYDPITGPDEARLMQDAKREAKRRAKRGLLTSGKFSMSYQIGGKWNEYCFTVDKDGTVQREKPN